MPAGWQCRRGQGRHRSSVARRPGLVRLSAGAEAPALHFVTAMGSSGSM